MFDHHGSASMVAMPTTFRRVLVAALMLLACGLLASCRGSRSPQPAPSTGRPSTQSSEGESSLDDAPWRTWRIAARLKISNRGTREVRVTARMPVPVSQPRQEVQVESVSPRETGRLADPWGNPLVESRAGSIPAKGSATVTMEMHVRGRHLVVDVDAATLPVGGTLPAEARAELPPTADFPSQDPILQAEVQALLEGEANPWYRALRLYDFTRSLRFQMARRPQGVRDVLRTRVAQCSDAAALFVTLCRAAGIPARYVAGIYLTENARTLDETHAWAEFWVPGIGWVPADPTMARFDDNLRLSRFGATVPEYVRLWGGTPQAVQVLLEPPGGAAPNVSLHFDVRPLPGTSGGRPLVQRFPVPALPSVAPSPTVTPRDADPAPDVEAARKALARGRIPEARALSERAVAEHPSSWPAWRTWLEATATETDLPGLARRVQASSRQAPAWIGRSIEGILHMRSQHWSKAREALAAAAIMHDSTETHENLGRFFLQTRQVSRALAEYSRALGCDPRNQNVHQDLISLYVALEAWEGVAQASVQAQGVFPSVVDFPLSAGQAFHRLGQHEKAREAFVAALRLTPGDGWLHAMLGWTLKEMHDPQGALQEIEQGLKLGIAGPEKAFFEDLVRDLKQQR